jgi:hypothetical protein
MKSKYVVIASGLLLLSCFGAPSFAASENGGSNQTDMPRRSSSSDRIIRRLIIEGSLVNAGYEGGDSSRYSKPNGYSAGALLDLIGTDKLVLETGALYRQLGTNIDNGLKNNTWTANYISVPVSAKYYFNGQENTSLYLKAGAMGSTLISNNTYYATPTTQIGARSWETAVLAGLGLKLNLSAETDLMLEADYNRALDSLFADSSLYRSDLAATLGFAVNL